MTGVEPNRQDPALERMDLTEHQQWIMARHRGQWHSM
jgi:hypothetical protein